MRLDVARIGEQVIHARLADAAYGYNAALEELSRSYDQVDLGVLKVKDWAPSSLQVFFAQAAPADLESESGTIMPMVLIFTRRIDPTGRGENRSIGVEFSGTIDCTARICLEWERSNPFWPFGKDVALCVSAMLSCLNSHDDNNWADPLLYDGSCIVQYYPIARSEQGAYRQVVDFNFTFEHDE